MLGVPAGIGKSLRVDESALTVVDRDRLALGLVGLEECVVRPPGRDSGELPGEVLGILNATVHAEAAVWREAVGCVPTEEDRPDAPAMGHRLLVVPAQDVQDLDVEVRDADGGADPLLQLRVADLAARL